MVDSAGSLRWDWDGLVDEIESGLVKGCEGGHVASIGVDGWGVDYGYLNEAGQLIDQPFAYRDSRTDSWGEIAKRIGHDELYRTTGIQLMGINTIFQLAADPPERLAAAQTFLLLPDLLVNHLTGWVGSELSNMSTTGLMNARTRDWSDKLIAALGIPRSLFPQPERAGTHVGDWNDIPVHLVGSHDTASAFLGAPSTGSRSVTVSTGSWVIVGVERAAPETTPTARASNFSNEAGALGGVRFLKNVVGFWILEQCRGAWGDPDIEDLITEAEMVEGKVPVFDASDHRFVGPDDMLEEVLTATGLAPNAPRGVVARSIIESIVEGVVSVVAEIEIATAMEPENLVIVGGGARIPLLASLLEERSGLEVVVGSPEAAALGNAIAQGIALGRFTDLVEARRWLAPSGVAA